jgi:hypothetical protein
MAIFEFECPLGHITELMVKLEEKPATVACGGKDCAHVATPILSATPTSFRQNDRKAFKRQGH